MIDITLLLYFFSQTDHSYSAFQTGRCQKPFLVIDFFLSLFLSIRLSLTSIFAKIEFLTYSFSEYYFSDLESLKSIEMMFTNTLEQNNIFIIGYNFRKRKP
jgi:hypothetical protein